MRFVEWGLMSLPAALVVAWLMGVRTASFRILGVTALGLAVLGGLLFWMGDSRGFTGAYTPATLRNGQVVSGQGS